MGGLRAGANAIFAAIRGRLPLVDSATATALATECNRKLEDQLAASRELAATRHERLTAIDIRMQVVTKERDCLWEVVRAAALRVPQASASATTSEFYATPCTAF